VFVHSLKLTVKAALRGVFSIAAMVTVITAFGLQKNMRGLVGWIEFFAGMGGDGSETVRDGVGMGVKSAGMGTKIPSPCTPLRQRERWAGWLAGWRRVSNEAPEARATRTR